MNVVQIYIEHIKEETDGAKNYAYLYVQYKNEKPKWANMYSQMANEELIHAGYILTMAKEQIPTIAWISDEDKKHWEECQSYYAEQAAIVKLMLQA